MRNLARFALSIGAAALFVGCGGSQMPLGAPTSRSPASAKASLTHGSATYAVVYSFESGERARDGAHPNALINLDGTFYGTTAGTSRGLDRYGTIFTMTPSGTGKLFFRFRGAPKEGADPKGLTDVGGRLFGTTARGGSNGFGTVYSITRPGNLTTLHSFTGGQQDGADPKGLVNVNGTLYGTTSAGGTHGDGTVFSITSSGVETVLYNFDKKNGATPAAPLIDVHGTLYGTTSDGGASGKGTVFAITPSGTETVLYSFKGGTKDGAAPVAALVDVHGTLYGTTWSGGSPHCGGGCGTVFAITPSGKETVLYIFQAGTTDGAYPGAAVADVHGTLYGTTFYGGADSFGTAFAIAASGKESILHSFAGYPADGQYPEAALLNANGTLYGTTYYGGSFGAGTVFALTP